MADLPVPWAPIGQALELSDAPEAITYCVTEGCGASLGGSWGDALIHHEDGSHTAVPSQEHGCPQETKQEETQ